jgi:GAF domain-containing protein
LVDSYNRPGRNATGCVILSNDIEAKRLGLLREIVPAAMLFGAMLNPNFPPAAGQLHDLETAAANIGRKLFVAKASNDAELDASFAALTHESVAALIVASDPFFDTRRTRIIAFATENRLPAIYHNRGYAFDGGLISYGPNIPDAYQQAGAYTGRILNGAKPDDLPVTQPTKFDFVINLKTAKVLGISIPAQLLARSLRNSWRAPTRLSNDRVVGIFRKSQAVIAIENARLLRELRQRTDDLAELLEQQTATSDVLQVISSSPGDLEPVFQTVLQNATRLCEAKFGNLLLADDAGFRIAANHGAPDGYRALLATTETLRVISSSPGDLAPVFEAVLQNAMRLCDAKFGNFLLSDGGGFRIAASRGAPAAYRERLDKEPTVLPREQFEEVSIAAGPEPDVPLARLAATKQLVHIADITATPSYQRRFRPLVELADLGGARTLLLVPMLKEQRVVGAIALCRQEVREFSKPQIDLLENFAQQSVIAIENTRLLDELRQRTDGLSDSLEQQTATSDVLQVISSSPGELEPVFATILEKAVRICGAHFGNIFQWDGSAFALVATHNTPPAFAEARKRLPYLHKKVAQIVDATKWPGYVDRSDPAMIAAVELGGVRTVLAIPMLKDDEHVGALVVYRRAARPFSEKQIGLLTNLAAQAVIAIENARLLGELRQRTDELWRSVGELKALGEVSQAVNSTLDLETVLATIVTKAVQLSGTDAGAIYVFDERQREFYLRSTYGMNQELIAALRQRSVGLDDPNLALAMARGEPIQVADLQDDAQSPLNEIILRAGFRARLVAPLIHGGEVVGMLVVRRRTPGAFAANTVDLMRTFAAQSVLAIQNARLFHEIEDKSHQIEAASKHKSQFLANMSHELRTPLNAILGYTELILDSIYGEAPEKMRSVLERVQANGRHLLGLINDVLDLSKIEAGQLTLSLSEYSIAELVQNVYVAVEPLASQAVALAVRTIGIR